MQAGARVYPAPPLPEQHLAKPREEAKLDPAPMYDAPHYAGSDKLVGRVALITGADSGKVGAVHPKAMPLILTSTEEMDAWVRALAQAAALQRPLQDGSLMIVEPPAWQPNL
jgi:putative SOS response-associated peptidase YedK